MNIATIVLLLSVLLLSGCTKPLEEAPPKHTVVVYDPHKDCVLRPDYTFQANFKGYREFYNKGGKTAFKHVFVMNDARDRIELHIKLANQLDSQDPPVDFFLQLEDTNNHIVTGCQWPLQISAANYNVTDRLWRFTIVPSGFPGGDVTIPAGTQVAGAWKFTRLGALSSQMSASILFNMTDDAENDGIFANPDAPK